MRTIRPARLLPLLSMLALGGLLGAGFAVAGGGDSPVIDVTTYDQVLDVDGTVVVEGGQGYVDFKDARGQAHRVEVRGWNPAEKKGTLTAGSTVRVTGANLNGKKLEYRGHVTVLK